MTSLRINPTHKQLILLFKNTVPNIFPIGSKEWKEQLFHDLRSADDRVTLADVNRWCKSHRWIVDPTVLCLPEPNKNSNKSTQSQSSGEQFNFSTAESEGGSTQCSTANSVASPVSESSLQGEEINRQIFGSVGGQPKFIIRTTGISGVSEVHIQSTEEGIVFNTVWTKIYTDPTSPPGLIERNVCSHTSLVAEQALDATATDRLPNSITTGL